MSAAAELWSRALEVAPERAKVLSRLGQVRMELGDTEGAQAVAEAIVDHQAERAQSGGVDAAAGTGPQVVPRIP